MLLFLLYYPVSMWLGVFRLTLCACECPMFISSILVLGVFVLSPSPTSPWSIDLPNAKTICGESLGAVQLLGTRTGAPLEIHFPPSSIFVRVTQCSFNSQIPNIYSRQFHPVDIIKLRSFIAPWCDDMWRVCEFWKHRITENPFLSTS